ncbi:hypothetical protein [Cardinium endosymbiont of Culicoides punctatus]|uniref:hypothetical protein n=1 Tax=Cardinium endosymbiont of Culicoides punctatus TaxID=2304601 RepID=UPI00105854AA|nr:hypothetical protein [Cardinium endosymbiont of Culicoides punctatus]TDG94407.1 hypothetical protein CCPUN_08030 [Cardinium endosymbiont of Culicoides punctatus]
MIYKVLPKISLVVLCSFLLRPELIFADDHSLHQQKKQAFFAKNEGPSLYFGIKSWAKVTKKTIEQNWASGLELSMGPFIEWRPLNGIGIQTGLLYSYNHLCMVSLGINGKRVPDSGIFASFYNAFNQINNLDLSKGDRFGIALDNITLHTLSLPLHFYLHPDKNRQFVLYIGPRLVIALHAAYKKFLFKLNVDANKTQYHIKNYIDKIDRKMATDGTMGDIAGEIQEGIKGGIQQLFSRSGIGVPSKRDSIFSCSWDLGFAYNSSTGFMIGTNGVGIMLGYDFTHLFSSESSKVTPRVPFLTFVKTIDC